MVVHSSPTVCTSSVEWSAVSVGTHLKNSRIGKRTGRATRAMKLADPIGEHTVDPASQTVTGLGGTVVAFDIVTVTLAQAPWS